VPSTSRGFCAAARIMMVAVVAVSVAGCITSGRHTAASSPSTSATTGARDAMPAWSTQVDRIAGHALAQQGAGVSVAVEQDGHIVLAKGYGLADMEDRVPATAQTVYPIASVTKQFTAAAIMQLVEQGRLHLNDSLAKVLPELAWRDERARHVTVRELLTHTSGIPGYTSLPGFRRLDAHPQSHASILALITGQPLKFAPGTHAGYSNSGYYLLGLIIERRSGLTYAQYLQRRLFAGLGLSHTGPCPDRPLSGQAHLYIRGGRAPQPAPRISLANAYAAGQLCSTVVDLLHWQDALRSGQVVSPASYTQMTTPLRLADGSKIAYGFGLDLDPIDGHPAISHEGGFPGDAADLTWYPNDHLAIAVLANASTTPAWTLSAEIAHRIFG
jgi:D-alanyl-D-alanine carboxypeptidase